MAKRKTPILLRRAPLSGGIVALHRYSWRQDRQMLEAHTDGKQDVTADFDALMLESLLDPDSPDMAAILDGVAQGRGDELTDDECRQVRAFRERLVAIIERHNNHGHGSPE